MTYQQALNKWADRVYDLSCQAVFDLNRRGDTLITGVQFLCWMYLAGALTRTQFLEGFVKEVVSEHVIGDSLVPFSTLNKLDEIRAEIQAQTSLVK